MLSPNHATGNRALLKHTRILVNASLITAPAPVPLNGNLLQREVFDYDFSRERVFLEIAEAELKAQKEKSMNTSGNDGSSSPQHINTAFADEHNLAQQTTSLSLDNRHVHTSSTTRTRTQSDDNGDIAAAISASLREY